MTDDVKDMGLLMKLRHKKEIVFCGLFLLSVALIVYKCRYGYAFCDECFYLSIPYRLTMGDGLMLHEWHPSQLAGFILYPFVSAYLRFVGTTDGIILFFRYLYTLLHVTSSLLIFHKLRRDSFFAASAVTILYVLYAPFGIMALSYNSMGLGCMVLSMVLLGGQPKRKDFAFSGILYALAVLCCPYLVLLYLVYFLFQLMKLPPWTDTHECRGSEGFLLWTGGIGAVTIVFFAFLFSRMTFRELMTVLPYILSDPEHLPRSLISIIRTYFLFILDNRLMKASYLAAFVLTALAFLDRKRQTRKTLYFVSVSVLVAVQIYNYCEVHRYINYLILPLNTLFPLLYLLNCSGERKTTGKRILSVYFVPGVVYTFCIHCASNQKLYNISSASFVILIGTLLLLGFFLQEVLQRYRHNRAEKAKSGIAILTACLIVAAVIVSMGELRYSSVFWETAMEDQNQLITKGPEKGILTSEKAKKEYDSYLEEIQNCIGEGKTLFLSREAVMYLIAENEFAAHSAWLSGRMSVQIDRLRAYYGIHPDKVPDYIYCAKKYQEDVTFLMDDDAYSMQITENGNYVFSRNKLAD